MPGDLVILDGSTFFISDAAGDVDGEEGRGFFFADMRHLSRWQLLVDGRPIRPLTSRPLDYYSARVIGTLPEVRVGVNPPMSIRRDRIVADGIHEDIVLENYGLEALRVRVELRFAADFLDFFEMKAGQRKRGAAREEHSAKGILLRYERDSFRRATRLVFGTPGQVTEGAIQFDVSLAPRQRWETCVDIRCITGDVERAPRCGHGGIGKLHPQMPLSIDEWLSSAPMLETTSDDVRRTYRQSLVDLASLRFRPNEALTWSLPAAGLPWFMALFGRDCLISAYQALPFQWRLAQTALEALAGMQADRFDDFRDAEPGKILHELRRGELTELGESPHSPYYGSHDATPLFLIVLDEYERWTGDVAFVRRLEPAARAALAWIEGPGDPDRDGYLEYRTRSPKGLANQSWKDSWNSILFADGRLAEPPIATCELQGYAYDARRRTARLARECWGDAQLAARLEADAERLRQQFNRDFWSHERGHYVLALDGHKRQVDALTSNIGHLLWSGIAEPRLAEATAKQLMAPEMFSGWGIRTMSARDAGYNPIEYHDGTIWPHDTAIIAEGLRRYGFRAEASKLAATLFEAAAQFDYCLPEVFAGFGRDETRIAVEYATASRPQAWAAGAPLLALRTLLGIDPDGPELRCRPALPAGIGSLCLRGVEFRGSRRDVS